MKTYGVMLVGCGHIGMEHLNDIYFRENIRVEAVVDTDPKVAEAAWRRSGASRWGTDYRLFLEDEHIDIVIIATYTDSHLPILKDCLVHGKHVLCEKPIANTYEDGRAFVDAVKTASTKVLVAHILRHNQSYQKMHDILQSGAVGEVKLIRMSQNHHAKDWSRYCRLLKDCSPAVDCGIHYYDIAQWLVGSPIVEVSGIGTKTQPDVPRENYTLVSFKMANGCIGYYEAGWGQSMRAGNVKEFIGTKGRITLEMQAQRGQDAEEGDLITVYHSDTGDYELFNLHVEYKDMYAQLQTLIDMIENGTEGDPTIDEVWSAFQVALSADNAITNRKTVYISTQKG